jgi:two-component system response regulator AtoC
MGDMPVEDLTRTVIGRAPNCFLYGIGPSICALDRMIDHLAPTEIPVLLVGESGTGKEEIALEIHYRSQRSHEPFLKFDCRQAPSQQYPAWLSEDQISKIKAAHRGTILFGEIGQLTTPSQERLFQQLTDASADLGTSPKLRIISATARSLEDEVRDGRFSQELYLMITGVCLFVPSLRNRPEDIPAVFELLLKKHSALLSRPAPKLSSSTMQRFISYGWPGNVRELETVATKIIELGDQQLVQKYLSQTLAQTTSMAPRAAGPKKAQSLKEAVRESSENVERALIVAALERNVWNQKRAAEELQISSKAIHDKMLKLGLGTCHSPRLAKSEGDD